MEVNYILHDSGLYDKVTSLTTVTCECEGIVERPYEGSKNKKLRFLLQHERCFTKMLRFFNKHAYKYDATGISQYTIILTGALAA